MTGKGSKSQIDWEAVEREYRTGIRSLRDIATEFGCVEGAIRKKAKAQEWERDISAKVAAKAEALVRRQEVRAEVRTENAVSEREQINASAQMMADTVLSQRDNVKRAMAVVIALWNEVEAAGDYTEKFRRVGEMMRNDDDFGQDRLNDMYHAAIGMPQRVKNVKLLADALKVLIELQRKILKLDEQTERNNDSAAKMSDAQRVSRIAYLLSKAGAAKQ